MKFWEYHRAELKHNHATVDELNLLGADGWELVSVETYEVERRRVFWFKRYCGESPDDAVTGTLDLGTMEKEKMTTTKVPPVQGQYFIGDAPHTMTATFQDKNGKTVAPDSVPVWSVTTNPTTGVLAITPAQDGMSCTAAILGAGTAVVLCTAECDPTPGVDTIVLEGDITVSPDDAVTGTLSLG